MPQAVTRTVIGRSTVPRVCDHSGMTPVRMTTLGSFRDAEESKTPPRAPIPREGRVMRKFPSTLLGSLLAAFCVLGFLASFEPGNHILWRFGYGIAFLIFVVAAASPWLGRTRGP